jgi:Neocarzinostatin family
VRNTLRLVIAGVLVVGATGFSAGAASATAPTMTVTPDTGLESGQTVTVSGSGLGPAVSLTVSECVALPPIPEECSRSVPVQTTNDGAYSTPYVVQNPGCGVLVLICAIELKGADGNAVDFDFISFDRHAAEPDVVIRRRSDGHLLFDNVPGSPLYVHGIAPGGAWTFAVLVQNDGHTAGDVVVTAPTVASPFAVHYFLGYYDVTSFVTGSGLTLPNVAPGGQSVFAIRFTATPDVVAGAAADITLSATSPNPPSTGDSVHVGVKAAAP